MPSPISSHSLLRAAGTIAWRPLLLLVLLGSTAASAFADHSLPPRHRVLLINSYHAGYPWSDGITTALGAELARAENTLELSVEYLDAIRHSPEKLAPEMVALLQEKYRLRQPDVLIVADDPALQFILPRREKLFPGVPLVFCGINNYSDTLLAGQKQITGVVENLDMAGTIELILRLHPQAGKIAFITGSNITAQGFLQNFRQTSRPYRDRVAFIELTDLSLDELTAALRQLPPDTVILHTPILHDRDGVPLSPRRNIELITEHTGLPFYSLWEHAIGDKGIGGIVTSAAGQGEVAAFQTMQILRGVQPEQIPIRHDLPNRPIFNYPALQHYRIREVSLPPGSEVRNRPAVVYRDYPGTTFLAGLGFVLLFGLVFALLSNIMKRRQAMMLLRTRKNQLQQIVESLPVGVWLADRDGRLIMGNSAGRKIWGEEKSLGIEEYGIFKGWWADSGRLIAAEEWGMARALRRGETSLDELIDIESFDGERKTITHSAMPLRDIDGAIIGGMVVAQDVTERLRKEDTLRALANEWQNTFNAVRDAIVILDRDFRILHSNQAFVQLVAREPQLIIGRHCWELVHHSATPLHSCPYARMLESRKGETSEFCEGDNWWETRVDPIVDDDGRLCGAIHIISDITARKRAEIDRQALISQLEERNTELEQFTYSVSHDLKTPLVTISGFVGQLREDLTKNNRDCVAIDLDFIESSAIQMGKLLDNLLHLARSGRAIGDPQPVDLARSAREAVDLASGILTPETVRFNFPAELPPVPGDRDRLREVFQNLIENAAKFCQHRQPPLIEIGGEVAGSHVRCWVRDNGIGIPQPYLERIFGLFERLDNSSPGTGIGLSLARRIVEKHGGRIWAESVGVDQGSTFYFILPV